jgi:type IV secretion system protein VirB6
MKPFTELMDVILSPLKSSAVHGAANLAGNIGTTVQLCLTIYIILFGWQIARGEIAEPWNAFAKRAVKLGLIVAILQSPALYKEVVIDFLAETLPDALSNAMSSNPVPDANKFDTLAAKFGILLTQIWQGTGWSAPSATARAAVVTLIIMPLVWCSLIVGFVVTMWAKAGMYFVATLGPLFIALAMFEQTRRYLHNWLDQIVTMIALQVLVAMTCGLVLEGLERAVKDAPTPENMFALAGKVIVLTVFSLAIWSSLPRLASKLGGYGVSVAGAGSRAAPLDTLRAPIASLTEQGAAPTGRPELASIHQRASDRSVTVPIVPSAIVPPTKSINDPGAGGPRSSNDTSNHAANAEHHNTWRAREQATGQSAPVAAGTSTDPAIVSRTLFARADFEEPTASGRGSPSSEASHAGSEGVPVSHTPSRSRHDFDRSETGGDTQPAPNARMAGTVAALAGRSDAFGALAQPLLLDADALIAEPQTGFDGLEGEPSSPRAGDSAIASAAIGTAGAQPVLPLATPSTPRRSS